MTTFVLRETLASEKFGYPIYFEAMTNIGPHNTNALERAAKFDSTSDAARCPAMRHMLSCYEIEPAP